MRDDTKHWREHARSVCSKWKLKQVRSCFVAEYVDRRRLSEENDRLLMKNRSLAGRLGVQSKRNRQMTLSMSKIEHGLRKLSGCPEFDATPHTVYGMRISKYFGQIADKILAAIKKGGVI